MNRTGILIANGALLVLCCFLAARVLTSVAAEFLAPPPAEEAALAQRVDPTRHAANDPQLILQRNLFKVSTLGSQPVVQDEEIYEKTNLPLRLLGTAALGDAAHSWAAVEDLDSRDHLIVRLNDQLKGKAQVIRIKRRCIVLQNGPRREELCLEEGAPSLPTRQSARSSRRRPPSTAARGNNLKANIRRLGENRFSVPRADVESIASSPAALLSQARILPKYQDGEVIGVQLNSIKAGSLFEQIGFQDGDTITEFNGIQVTGHQASSQVLREFTDATEFDVSVTGASGETRRLQYQVR